MSNEKQEYIAFVGSPSYSDYGDYEGFKVMRDITRILLTRKEANLLKLYMKAKKGYDDFVLLEVKDQKSIESMLKDAIEWQEKREEELALKAATASQRKKERDAKAAEKALAKKRLLLEELKKELNEE